MVQWAFYRESVLDFGDISCTRRLRQSQFFSSCITNVQNGIRYPKEWGSYSQIFIFHFVVKLQIRGLCCAEGGWPHLIGRGCLSAAFPYCNLWLRSRHQAPSWFSSVLFWIMPRTLPWLRAENNIPVKKVSTPRKRVKTEPSPDRDLTPKNPRVSPPRRDFFRSCKF